MITVAFQGNSHGMVVGTVEKELKKEMLKPSS